MALSGYGVYAEVTFAASAVDEAIPFLTVYLSDLPTAWHDAMANAGDSDGRTIRVTKSDGTTECAVYVPPGSVNTSTDTGALFFHATDLSAVVDTVYMIWVGNAASTMYLSTDTYGRNAVFTGYAGAYILNSLTNCTGSGSDMVATNLPTAGASTNCEGITGYRFTAASSQYLSASSAVLTSAVGTIEMLAECDNTTARHSLGGIAHASFASANQIILRASGDVGGDPVTGLFAGNSGSGIGANSTAGYTENSWFYAAIARTAVTSGTQSTWLNGANVGTSTTDLGSNLSGANRTCIGARVNSTPDGFTSGTIAVVLFSASARSADYVSTMNKNWLGTLYSASAVMYVTGTTGKLKLQSAATTTASGSRADWATVTNALTIATDVATATVDETTIILSEFLELTNIAYNYAVPSGKSNYAIKYYLTRRFQTGSARDIQDQSARFIDETGTYAGTDLAIGGAWEAVVTTKTYTVAGVTLSDASFDASTGFALQVTGFNTNGNTEARVEFICAEITWDEGAPATDYGNFFEAYGAFGNVA